MSNNLNIATMTPTELHAYVCKMATKLAKKTMSSVVNIGTIVNAVGISTNTYTIQLHTDTNTHVARALSATDSYQEGDEVYVTSMTGTSNGVSEIQYFIFGKVTEVQQDFVKTTNLDRFTVAEGEANRLNNIILDLTNNFCATLDKTTYSFLSNPALRIDYMNTTISRYINQGFDYGLEVNFIRQQTDGSGNEIETVVEKYIINTAYMQGQPFNCQGIQQSYVLERKCADDAFHAIQIKSFGQEYGTINNINLIGGAITHQHQDLTTTLRGIDKTYWRQTPPSVAGEDVVTLEATFSYLSKEVIDTKQYYWFVKIPENPTFSPEVGTYVPEISGEGWYCLNNSYEVEFIDAMNIGSRVWDTQSNRLVLDKFVFKRKSGGYYFDKSLNENIPFQYSNQIKCVVKYNDMYISSAPFEIIDQSQPAPEG